MKISTLKKYLSFAVSAFLVFAPFATALPAQAAVSNWEKGISVVPSGNSDFSSGNFQQSMRNFQADGGNYVNFIIPICQSNVGSTDIQNCNNTPTDSSLAQGIQFVHSLGMHAQIGLYLNPWDGNWRAYINPSERNTWYQKYGDELVHYGQLAQQNGVEQYVLGAELIDMASAAMNPDNTQRWDGMIARVRAVYGGTLTYSANRGNAQGDFYSEWGNIQFWDKLDMLGLSAYYALPGDGSVSSLEGDWANLEPWDIAQVQQKWGKPVLFTEVGYRSVSNAHNQPWDSWDGGNYDPQEQANDYTALLDFWNNKSYMTGVDLWWWSPDPNYGGNGNIDYTPQNKPAEGVLKQWWLNNSGGGGGGSNPPPTGTPTFSSQGSANPSTLNSGQGTTLGAQVTDSGNATQGAIVDLEVYQGSNKVFQKYFDNQTFSQGQTQNYTTNWTPGGIGTYTEKIGTFSSGWSQNYSWNDNAATITVGGGSGGGGSTPPPNNPPPSNMTTDVWWPTDGTHVSGLQPFKAMVENIDVSQYQMYWQVDGGGLVQMQNNSTDWPHKEALVDLSGWSWKGAGPYTVNFVSKDSSGNTISQKSVQIWTQ